MQAEHIPTISVQGNDTLTLYKGIFTGLKIKSIESRSTLSH